MTQAKCVHKHIFACNYTWNVNTEYMYACAYELHNSSLSECEEGHIVPPVPRLYIAALLMVRLTFS